MRLNKIVLLLFLGLSLKVSNASEKENKAVSQIEIKDGWKFRQADKNNWMPASVPGCVHTDLLDNKVIEDPFFSVNEKAMQWIGEKDWTYETSFDAGKEILKAQNLNLVFKGLDTYAKVYLNDVLILSADNMFREWSAGCKNLIKAKGNHLRIEFRDVFDENLPKYNNAPYRLMSFDNNDQAEVKINMYSRKAGFHFGWDWGPRLVTYGIWRPVYLEAWNSVKLNDVFVTENNVSKEKAGINSFIEVISGKTQSASVKMLINDKEETVKAVKLNKGLNKIDIAYLMQNPRLWWTNGLGEQYLYNFKYVITTEDNYIDTKTLKIGVRSLEVVREKDSIGTSFYFKLNGVPVFAKGSDYIPQDNFQNRITAERYRHIIKSAADVNMNILRIWGGGLFEDDMFYNLCDEYGILIWHDMMFACGMFPSDTAYIENVKHEIIDNVKRIRNHPALAMYCGNNENEISWDQWGWKPEYKKEVQQQYESALKNLFYNVIPNTLKEVDPTRYYHPSSPSAGFLNFSYNDGDAHYWGVWHGKDPFEKYNDNIARFMSEYGFQSYPEMSTIEKFTKPEDRYLHSEVILSHQRCMSDARKDKEYGNRLIQTYMDRQYRQPKDFGNFLYVSQLVQAEGVKMAVDAHRRNMPKCMGTMYWQIDDCWPVASWSSIDYYGNWKALHYYAKNVYEPVHAAPYMNNDMVEFYIISDKLEPLEAELELTTMDFNGKIIQQKKYPVNIKANASNIYLKLKKDELTGGENENKIFVDVKVNRQGATISRSSVYFKYQKDLALEKPEIKCTTVKIGDAYSIELRTDKLAKNVYLNSAKFEGSYSDNYFDLIPGEVKTIVFTPKNHAGNPEQDMKIISLFDTY